MRTQLSGKSGSATRRDFAALLARSILVAAALLMALGSLAAVRAIPLSDVTSSSSEPARDLGQDHFEVTPDSVGFGELQSGEIDFGTAGLAVTGPLAAGGGESRGLVFGWKATAKDPAHLVTVGSLFSKGIGGGAWVAGEILRTRPDLGVVPNGNLSVFDTGAVDSISWNFLEFSSALLALRLEDYARLAHALGPADIDLGAQARSANLSLQQRPVPEPATALLLGQGILALALLRPRRGSSASR